MLFRSMAVAQRATSVAGLTNGSDVYVALDRFGFNEFGSPSSQHTMTQEIGRASCRERV